MTCSESRRGFCSSASSAGVSRGVTATNFRNNFFMTFSFFIFYFILLSGDEHFATRYDH